MTVISETALLAGLIFTVQAGGKLLTDAPQAILESPRTGFILTLLLIGFGIKAGTVPLHVWLPLAHPAAPPAASAVLSGAMVKAGMVGFLRFFPLQQADAELDPTIELFGTILMVLALLGAFAVVAIGVLQRDAKTILAYSTISQMGFIGALIAAGLLDGQLAEDTIEAAVLYAVHHGLAKGALFLGVPVIKHYGKGAAGVMVTIGMVGSGLAVAGAPITSGGIGKYVSKDAVEGLTVIGIDLYSLLPFVATGSTVLLLRFLWVVLGDKREQHAKINGELLSWLIVSLAGIVVPWLVAIFWSPLHLPEWTDLTTVWDATWPILLGLVVGVGCWLAYRAGWIPASTRESPLIPAGDLVVVEEHLVRRMVSDGGHALDRVHDGTTRVRRHGAQVGTAVAERLREHTDRIESTQRPWPRFGTLAVMIITVVVLLSLVLAGGNQ
jgi:formate hydrogenlyase subunit 3/multisubunit Na+/H+ antiporter MnhD subunit